MEQSKLFTLSGYHMFGTRIYGRHLGGVILSYVKERITRSTNNIENITSTNILKVRVQVINDVKSGTKTSANPVTVIFVQRDSTSCKIIFLEGAGKSNIRK